MKDDSKDTVVVNPGDVSVMSPYLVQFSKPYVFEGETYTAVDLGGLESLTAANMIEAEKHLARSGVVSPIPEMSMEYVTHVAVQVSDKPLRVSASFRTRASTQQNRAPSQINFKSGTGIL